ncbi:hypothetical protein Clacol_005108 [Clathrus columnatus]|uniref:Carboxylic ester hydrolase n=1 Tax=Clathrus columnatus TaxID=1419009 RepID=A0AAV5AD87_9AGAM|nr:hypothetical protein Clacol_005108 [Clathrus columnatus]
MAVRFLSACIVTALIFGISGCVGLVLPIATTTSGVLHGSAQDGVLSFKGIVSTTQRLTRPYARSPIGALRWEPPQPLLSNEVRNTTAFGPSCIQQFTFATQAFIERLFNTPPLPENEDCLFLNVWTPQDAINVPNKPVLVWIHGGSLQFGSGRVPEYNGMNIAQNHGIVVVTINYRTNVFGFPEGEELFPNNENLGYMDQDLTLKWVQDNIAAFGGNPELVTIVGESAGSQSVAQILQRHSVNPPFRAAIMESGAASSTISTPNFTSFDIFAKAVGCNQAFPGPERLACLKSVPASQISTWLNGPSGLGFGNVVVDNVTVFPDPYQRIKANKTARVPILIGANQDDGTLFVVGDTDLATFLQGLLGSLVTVDQVRAVYPGFTDLEIIPLVFRDVVFLCPAELTTTSYVQSGITSVFRYVYGAVFADLQLFPNAGAWHSTEIPEIFGTFNITTASGLERTLSTTMQSIWTNFIKDPFTSPALKWQKFVPGNNTLSLARLAFTGNVELDNVVQPSPAGLDDGPCDNLWNALLDF